LALVGLAYLLKRFLVVDLEIICVQFNAQKLLIDLVNGLDVLFNIGLILVFSFDLFVGIFWVGFE
jgi:hypothetical protein